MSADDNHATPRTYGRPPGGRPESKHDASRQRVSTGGKDASVLAQTIQLLLGYVFLNSGISKLEDRGGAAKRLRQTVAFTPRRALLLAPLLGATEGILAVFLLSGARQSVGLLLTAALLGAYSVALTARISLSGTSSDCGCGSTPAPRDWSAVLRNTALQGCVLLALTGAGQLRALPLEVLYAASTAVTLFVVMPWSVQRYRLSRRRCAKCGIVHPAQHMQQEMA